MMQLLVTEVHTESHAFARHHAIHLPAAGAELTAAEQRDDGGFGVVHPVLTLDARQPAPSLVVKVLKPEGVAAVGGPGVIVPRVASLHRALAARGERNWPAVLLALPFSLFTADVGGREALVALMLDLEPLGYGRAAFVGDDPQARETYRHRDLHDRIDLAARFAEGAALLEEIAFLHGDLNPENVLVNLATLDVQIIDLDAGVVSVTGGERPITDGKRDECMPPEIKVPGPAAEPVDRTLHTLAAERWSVGSLVAMALLGLHPGFFLLAFGPQTIAAYARDGPRWPDVDVGGPHFSDLDGMRDNYARVRPAFDELPATLRELIADFFDAGVDGDRRPSARQWAVAFEDLREPPELLYVAVEEAFVAQGSEVVLSWEALNADHVESPVLGTLPPAGSVAVVVEQSVSFTLTPVNRYGPGTPMRSSVVRVVPLPRIETIPVPAFPGLRLSTGVAVHALPLVPIPRFEPPRLPFEPPAPRFDLPRLPSDPVAPRIGLPGLPFTSAAPRPPTGRTRDRWTPPTFPSLPDLGSLIDRLLRPLEARQWRPFDDE